MPWTAPEPPAEIANEPASPLDREETILRQLTTGLLKIGLATRQHAWAGGERRGLTPTQGQALAYLLQRAPAGARVSELATALGIAQATASVMLKTLVDKGLIERRPSPDDARAVTLTLTEAGVDEAQLTLTWTDFLLEAVDELNPEEQAAFQRAVVKMIRAMQLKGDIPVSRMCVTCTWFRPNAHPGGDRPHHCAFVDAPFGDRQLRLDCSEFEDAAPELAQRNWQRFVAPEDANPPLIGA
jgi:DNA-binding MarR family transcriptional regulator